MTETPEKAPKTPTNPYKQREYKQFIKLIEGNTVEHWVNIAQALNVDKDTITDWKRLPEAQAAIQKGIDRALEGMQRAGGKDWRMWESKIKMLGINPIQKLDVTSGGEKLPIMGGSAKVKE